MTSRLQGKIVSRDLMPQREPAAGETPGQGVRIFRAIRNVLPRI